MICFMLQLTMFDSSQRFSSLALKMELDITQKQTHSAKKVGNPRCLSITK